MRGFMLRTVDADGTVNSWEFLGMQNSSPRKTWDYHFGLTPAQGRNRNLLESAIGIAKNKFSTPGAIVEVVGLTRMPINDFNSQKTVNKLASSINYCTTLQDGRVVGAYSIAAIVFEKGRKNIVFSQTPLPRHAAGSTTHGRFVIPYAVVNDKLSSFSQAAQAQNSADAKKTELNRATKVATDFPLRVEDHVNGMGQVSAFNIIANDGDIGPWAERVVNSIDDITPIKIATRAAYSYPIRFRAAVLASLSDLMGTPHCILKISAAIGLSSRAAWVIHRSAIRSTKCLGPAACGMPTMTGLSCPIRSTPKRPHGSINRPQPGPLSGQQKGPGSA